MYRDLRIAERAGLWATTEELCWNRLAGGQLVGRRCGEKALGSCVGAAVVAGLGPGTALPSKDRGREVTGSSGTQFEGRTSVGCGVEELHFKDNLGRFFFFN